MQDNFISEIRYCQDIGMFAIDRPKTSCRHRTIFCNENCYNNKLYKLYKLTDKDTRNEKYWENLTGEKLNIELSLKKHQTNRIRLMTRGEAFSDNADIDQVKDLLLKNPDRLFWIPTRAWRSKALKTRIESEIMPFKNARIQASIDPSNTMQEVNQLVFDGWSTMFFGDNNRSPIKAIKCQKTWQHKKGACANCKIGCFSKNQNHVWLKKH